MDWVLISRGCLCDGLDMGVVDVICVFGFVVYFVYSMDGTVKFRYVESLFWLVYGVLVGV